MRYLVACAFKKGKEVNKIVGHGRKSKTLRVNESISTWQIIDTQNNCEVVHDDCQRDEAIEMAATLNRESLEVA